MDRDDPELDADQPPPRPRGRGDGRHGGVPRRLRHEGHGGDGVARRDGRERAAAAPPRPPAPARARARRRPPAASRVATAVGPSSTGRTGRYYIDVDPNDQTKHGRRSRRSPRSTARRSTTRRSSTSNEEFVANDRERRSKAGKDTGWDMITLTDWMAAKLVRRGWVETFDHGQHAQPHRQPQGRLHATCRGTRTTTSTRRGRRA